MVALLVGGLASGWQLDSFQRARDLLDGGFVLLIIYSDIGSLPATPFPINQLHLLYRSHHHLPLQLGRLSCLLLVPQEVIIEVLQLLLESLDGAASVVDFDILLLKINLILPYNVLVLLDLGLMVKCQFRDLLLSSLSGLLSILELTLEYLNLLILVLPELFI